jgi:hypothetical protein
MAESSPHLRLDFRVKSHVELNAQFQACDLLWCWTAARSSPYASGTCSDQYCSGTRLVVANKQQHAAVLGHQNVVAVDGDVRNLMRVLIDQVENKDFARHDGSDLSWQRSIQAPAAFLKRISAKRRAE